MSLIVRELTVLDEGNFIKGFKEWEGEDLSWYTFEFKFNDDFADHIERLEKNKKGIDLDARYVPSTILYGFMNGEIVGRVSIRHELNEYLMRVGGHIGYSVAPRFRKNGFATQMLGSALEYCKKDLKLQKILITCDDNNLGSIKIIEKHNGVLEQKVTVEDSAILKRRYWISLAI